jgi:hypothetical protein
MKDLRGATANCVGNMAKYLRRTTRGTAGSGLGRYRGLLMSPFIKCAPGSPCFVRASFANKKNITAEARVYVPCAPRI